MLDAEQIVRERDELDSLLALLTCPACRSTEPAWSVESTSTRCTHCDASFPVYASGRARIPWLFADPAAARHEWKARYDGFLQRNAAEQARLTDALQATATSNLGRARLESQLDAKRGLVKQVAELLEPLDFDGSDFDHDADIASRLHNKVPGNQGLLSYYNNVFRDWAWDNGENDHLLGTVHRALKADTRDELGAVLTLGAGASRLPYDLHREFGPAISVALDINPLLLLLASRVIGGESVSLYEFPLAPLNRSSFAVKQECHALSKPEFSAGNNFHFLFADAMNPPFAACSFDTVVTPWLIDIIPQNLAEFIPRINHVLDTSGVWVNTGSLAFDHDDECWRYSEEEVLELIETNGFEILSAERQTVPYLQSPHSAHGRTENLFSFAVRKIRDVAPPPTYDYLPEWILNGERAIPLLAGHAIASSNHLLHAQVLAAIDGKRSIDDIGALVARQYGFNVDEATHAVKRILIEVHES